MLFFKWSLLVTLFAAVTTATPIEKRHVKYIAYPLEQVEHSSLAKRYESEDFYGYQEGTTRYLTKLKVGSTKQEVEVFIDTGSWALNFPQVGGGCNSAKRECAADVSFDPTESTTFKNLSKFSKIEYGEGNALGRVTGFKSTDDFYFDNGDKLPNFEFTLVNETIYTAGIFGIGPNKNSNVSYAQAAKKAGYINQAGFSLYASPGGQGTFLLGGVDKAKIEGELAIYKSTLSVPAISVTSANGTVLKFPSNLALDTGNPGIGLDPEIHDEILNEVKDENGKISCDKALSGNKKLQFDFGQGVLIDVPYSDVFYWNDKHTGCNTRIASTRRHGVTQNVGIPLIKNLYLTNNFETGKLGVGKVKHTDESDIVDFWF
ncbi:Eukaryotic aspartyl protease family protein [Candida parapsilosis]|uniref:Peptidase A1 domain-containing protein n=2 Tax=Candida parapsilosis TaxID=5480 RepID=G8BKB1_CANPC|nr:uncharacterized protein CPAR2_701880 [Candida parapsilosis]KAF6042250.1 Eukaryotic aspartyl protease family protein [Candida parapsilosis]KAF6042529.1 Eukaryotic aspartyl protease family protein [Candida parapsilosis]KAF6042974.1 Eukaryotic aspartyl protease family protein [Candida parapsilosis]KAF6058017.1 Eukaryotic aspartyl protease family protein [Candida parapsilosis]KAI5901115.1 hypothetical protein K4G60_g241 [Candida parapsilosis]